MNARQYSGLKPQSIGDSQVCTRKWSGGYLRGLHPPRACTPCYPYRPLLSYPMHLVAWAPVPLPQSAEEHWAGSHRGDSRGRPPARPPEGRRWGEGGIPEAEQDQYGTHLHMSTTPDGVIFKRFFSPVNTRDVEAFATPRWACCGAPMEGLEPVTEQLRSMVREALGAPRKPLPRVSQTSGGSGGGAPCETSERVRG